MVFILYKLDGLKAKVVKKNSKGIHIVQTAKKQNKQ